MSYNGTKYSFARNLQGDVIAILSSYGATMVEYKYDAWGNVLSVTGALASTLGAANPFRYRGYYYDTETGFYYLNSRYYDPQVGRFLNADGIIGSGGIIGYNLFAYCNDNPIMYVDPSGLCPHDEKLYESGPFKDMPQYNAHCNLCKAHGSYSLTNAEGEEFIFYGSHSYDAENQLIEFIAGFETFSHTPTEYGCIGFGCSIKDNQAALIAVLGTGSPTEITEADAYALLRYVVNDHINQLYNTRLDDILGTDIHQIHALISFSYNVGNASEILNKIASTDNLYEAWTTTCIRGEIKGELVVLRGLVIRRHAEYTIYRWCIQFRPLMKGVANEIFLNSPILFTISVLFVFLRNTSEPS